MIDPLDSLLDDRSLVEVRGDEVRGRADELDATLVGLVVGARALEARQERVVDVDDPARQGTTKIVGQHLHVSGQHHDVDVVLLDQFEEHALLRSLGLWRHREVDERYSVALHLRATVTVVGDNKRDVDRQLTGLVPVEQIDETVSTYAQGWTLDRMPAVDRAILRVGTWEILWGDVPDAVALAEAVQLANDLSTDESGRYINGVLARVQSVTPRITLGE